MKTVEQAPPKCVRDRGIRPCSRFVRILDLTGPLLDRLNFDLLCPICTKDTIGKSLRHIMSERKVAPVFYQVRLVSVQVRWVVGGEFRTARYFVGRCSECDCVLWLRVPGFERRKR